jgi:hypothetical protein
MLNLSLDRCLPSFKNRGYRTDYDNNMSLSCLDNYVFASNWAFLDVTPSAWHSNLVQAWQIALDGEWDGDTFYTTTCLFGCTCSL